MSKKEDAAGPLRAALEQLVAQASDTDLNPTTRRRLETEIRDIIEQLSTLLNELDPVQHPTSIFDPSDPKIVGRFVALAMVAQTRKPLASIGRFYGSGVYAIYYNGPYARYAKLSGQETPIYVGKAQPALPGAKTARDQGLRLSGRLGDHRKNISLATSTLSINDFEYRALVVQSGWESAAETYLIQLFQPIWNSETKLVFGLGKHGDDAATRGHPRSPWDTLHPGRPWAAGSKSDAKTPAQIDTELAEHFSKHPVFGNIDAVLESFIEGLRQV